MIDKFGRTELGRYFYDPSLSSGITGDLYIRTDGNSTFTSDLDFNSHKIINLGEPTSAHDAATKNKVDTHSSGGTISSITSDLNLNSHKLINVNEPTSLQDAATKNYVDTNSQKSTYLGIDVKSSFLSLGLKSQILPIGLSDASSIFSYSDGPGILRRLWIAVNGTSVNGKSVPGNIFLRIYADGAICVGNYAIDTQGIGYDHFST